MNNQFEIHDIDYTVGYQSAIIISLCLTIAICIVLVIIEFRKFWAKYKQNIRADLQRTAS